MPDDLLALALDRAYQLERNAHSGQILVRIIAAVLLWVNDRHRLGQGLLVAFVVVGDDEVDACIPCVLCFVHCGYAAVNADDKAHAFVF